MQGLLQFDRPLHAVLDKVMGVGNAGSSAAHSSTGPTTSVPRTVTSCLGSQHQLDAQAACLRPCRGSQGGPLTRSQTQGDRAAVSVGSGAAVHVGIGGIGGV